MKMVNDCNVNYFPNYAVSAATRAITVGFHYTVQLLTRFVHVLIGFHQAPDFMELLFGFGTSV